MKECYKCVDGTLVGRCRMGVYESFGTQGMLIGRVTMDLPFVWKLERYL